jgi:hypothetical protein
MRTKIAVTWPEITANEQKRWRIHASCALWHRLEDESRMIDRKTVEWFVNRALEYQEIGAEDYTHDYRFEIGTRGSTAIIWQRDADENGVCM